MDVRDDLYYIMRQLKSCVLSEKEIKSEVQYNVVNQKEEEQEKCKSIPQKHQCGRPNGYDLMTVNT